MTSTQDHPKNTRQSARSAWGLIFTFIGLAIVLGSLVSFVLAQVDDDADKLLEAIYLAMIGMGTIAFGESRARSSSNED